MEIFIVTATGSQIDTEAHICLSHDEAVALQSEILDDFGVTERVELCADCLGGEGRVCKVEVEIHELALDCRKEAAVALADAVLAWERVDAVLAKKGWGALFTDADGVEHCIDDVWDERKEKMTELAGQIATNPPFETKKQ